ncbi:MAG: hypothetical protein ACI9ES_000015 [Oceanospirillaceae bacterium]|jgi:hypothetical protein
MTVKVSLNRGIESQIIDVYQRIGIELQVFEREVEVRA